MRSVLTVARRGNEAKAMLRAQAEKMRGGLKRHGRMMRFSGGEGGRTRVCGWPGKRQKKTGGD